MDTAITRFLIKYNVSFVTFISKQTFPNDHDFVLFFKNCIYHFTLNKLETRCRDYFEMKKFPSEQFCTLLSFQVTSLFVDFNTSSN